MSDMSYPVNPMKVDVLILGTGLAGMLLALELAECRDISIALVSKGSLADSNSSYAQGGVASALPANPFDSPFAHLADTLKSGAGLTDRRAAESIIFGGARLISELDRFGVEFDRNVDGKYSLALEGGHSQSRVLHNKDATGRAITSVLGERIRQCSRHHRNIVILEETVACDLITSEQQCIGARLRSAYDYIDVFAARTVLATGGAGRIFSRTTNPEIATADGVALAYRAGAKLADMEFVQFHPTALSLPGAPAFLISEAVRGAGAVLLDHRGQRFMQRFHKDGELATRDVVARAIHTVMKEHELPSIALDMRPIGSDAISKRFPNIVKTCLQFGLNVLSEPIPVSPAAHYFMGGVMTDVNGQTSLDGLYAIGECACTGLHGANRLASNSLLEAGVMAINLGAELIDCGGRRGIFAGASLFGDARRQRRRKAEAGTMIALDTDRFRTEMYRQAGLVRSEIGLSMLLCTPGYEKPGPLSRDDLAQGNIYAVGKLIARAALLRKESRGSHFREDHPNSDHTKFDKRLWLSRGGAGWFQATPSTEDQLAGQRDLPKTQSA